MTCESNSAPVAPPSNVWPAVVSALLAAALYAVTLAGTYVYDDIHVVSENVRVTDPHQWFKLWSEEYFPGASDNLYRPLVTQSYALQLWLHHGQAWPLHAVNILLHSAVAAAVAEWLRRLAGSKAAWMGGLLFAAHPVHVEAVANIVGRAETMCALGVIGAMVLLLHRPLTRWRVVAILALALLACGSKEPGFILPLLLPLMVWAAWDRRDARSEAEVENLKWLCVGLMFLVSGIIILREQVLDLKFEYERGFLDWTIQPLVRSPFPDRWLIVLALLGRYARLLMWPSKLSIDYGFAVITPTISRHDPYLYLGVAAAFLWLSLFIFSLIRRQRVVTFLLLGLAMTYGMASNVIIIGTILGERLMYLPSAFFLGLVALAVAKVQTRIVIAILIPVLAIASGKTFVEAHAWNDKLTFYERGLAVQPQSIRLYILLASQLDHDGQLDRAEEVLARGRMLAPDYSDVWVLSSLVAQDRGDLALGEQYLRRGFNLRPSIGLSNALRELREKRAKLNK